MKSKMQQTSELGSDWWNDSNDHEELQHAVNEGAVGATSNPVITCATVKNLPDVWLPVIDKMIESNTTGSEDDILWDLIDEVGKKAADILQPVYEKTHGQKGKLSLQVNPKYYRNSGLMFEQGKYLASLAPNIAVKCPALPAGIAALEKLTSNGICINATVSFTVAQAVAVAEAVERGLNEAEKNGFNIENLTPYVTIMVGRIDDHLKRINQSENNEVEPEIIDWASIAIFKNAYKIFQEKGYRSKLLAAAFRNHMHWSELVGGDIVISMPYEWWNKFNASDIEVINRINDPVDSEIIDKLSKNFNDFNRAFNEDGMTIEEFEFFGASKHTMDTFLNGYDEFIQIIRSRMINR